MKTIYTAIVLMLLTKQGSLLAQDLPVLTLITSIHAKGADTWRFDGQTQLEVQCWDQDELKIEITVNDPFFTRGQLKSLIPMGFFRIESQNRNGELLISMPGQEKIVTINGRQVNQLVKLKITAPRYLHPTNLTNLQ